MKARTIGAILFCAGVVVGWMLHPDAPPCEDAATQGSGDEFEDTPDTAEEDSKILDAIAQFEDNRGKTSIAAQRVMDATRQLQADKQHQFRVQRLGETG